MIALYELHEDSIIMQSGLFLREVPMSRIPNQSSLLRQARFFAGAAVVAAAVILFLSIVNAIERVDLTFIFAGATDPILARQIIDAVESLLARGGREAFIVCGAGIIVFAAVRLVQSGVKPSWAGGHDERFVALSWRFSRIVEIFAWVLAASLVYLGIVRWTTVEQIPAGFSRGAEAMYRITMMLDVSVAAITAFFTLMLGALLIRTLLLLSEAGGPPGSAERDAGGSTTDA